MVEPHDIAAELERYRPMILAVAFDRLGDAEAGEDIAQQVFEQALRHADALRDGAALPGWLRSIAIRCCLDHTRRQRCEPVGLVVEREADTPSAYHHAVQREMLRRVRRALGELPERNRLALLLHVVHGVPYEEIARLLDVPLTTVEGRIHRARRALRKEVAEWLREGLE